MRALVEQIGPSGAPILVVGETGTGKELAALAIHEASRRTGPLVTVSLAAVPPSTAASQLFGHVPGAFTGAATRHRGWFEQAEGGTLFLDEIGEASEQVQPLLLRALDRGEIQPVGGRVHRVDVRVVAATDLDVDALAAAGEFRRPLLYRFAYGRMHLPPLRDRLADVAVLWHHFVSEALRCGGKEDLLHPARSSAQVWMPLAVTEGALARAWPGNVRELRAAAFEFVEANLEKGRAIPPGPDWGRTGGDGATGTAAASHALGDQGMRRRRPATPTAAELRLVLEEQHWAVEPTARALGLSRNGLRAAMRRLGIPRAVELSDAEIDVALAEAGGDMRLTAKRLAVGVEALRARLHPGSPRKGVDGDV